MKMSNESLEYAQGIIKKAPRVFITSKDIMTLFGCSRSAAYNVVHEVNAYANKKGEHSLLAGKANKYTFAKLYGIPIEDINNLIDNE